MRDVAKVRKKVPSRKQTATFSRVCQDWPGCGIWVPGEWVTFDSTLEELREDAVGGQLMEDTAQELLGHTRRIAWDHHAVFKQRRKHKRWASERVRNDLEVRL